MDNISTPHNILDTNNLVGQLSKLNPVLLQQLQQLTGQQVLNTFKLFKPYNEYASLTNANAYEDAGNTLRALEIKSGLSNPSSNINPVLPKSLTEKLANSSIIKNHAGISAGLSAVNALTTSIIGERSEFSGKEGALAKSLDSGYDLLSEAAGNFGPWGKVVLLGMKANKLVSNIAGKLGGSTDGMTKVDSILGSPFFLMTPLGLINGFGGAKADSFTKDTDLWSAMGSSYGASSSLADSASEVLGKKYGAFSSGARTEANAAIAEARRLLQEVSKINQTAQNRFALLSSMSTINTNAYLFALQGGYDLSAIRVGRNGMVVRAKRILSTLKFKNGGKTKNKEKPSFEEWFNSIPENYRSSEYDYKLAYKVLPTELLLNHASDPLNYRLSSVSGHMDEQGRIPFLKLGFVWQNPEILKEFDVYKSNSELGKMLRSKYDIIYQGDRYYYIQKDHTPEYFTESSIIPITPVFKVGGNINIVKPKFKITEFKEGGSFNVIPEGALHAHKHHMENADNLTKKGIPVISEDENGKIQLLAEIEKEEIILRLSITKRLEELAKENTDESAIEAGKLLVQEILYNTIDNTNNLL